MQHRVSRLHPFQLNMITWSTRKSRLAVWSVSIHSQFAGLEKSYEESVGLRSYTDQKGEVLVPILW